MQISAFCPDFRLVCTDRFVGYRIGVADDAVNMDGDGLAYIFDNVCTVARTWGDRFAPVGGDDGRGLVVFLVECEVKTETAPGFHFELAGYRVGGCSFHLREGDGMVDRRNRCWIGLGFRVGFRRFTEGCGDCDIFRYSPCRSGGERSAIDR